MSKTAELEKCPLCGSTMAIYAFDDEGTAPDGGRRVRIECAEGEECSANTGWCDSMADAEASWNIRPRTPLETLMYKALRDASTVCMVAQHAFEDQEAKDDSRRAYDKARAAIAAYEKTNGTEPASERKG